MGKLTTVLIDGDILVYSCGFASDGRYYQVGGEIFNYKKEATLYCVNNSIPLTKIEFIVSPEPIEYCLHGVKQSINSILDATDAEDYIIYLSGKDNFRYKIAVTAPYKGNRDVTHRPTYYKEIKEYLVKYHRAEVVDGIEADDAMGFNQTPTTIIASLDKDLDMIEGWHYNWRKNKKYYVGKDTAIKTFYLQLLTGDPTDNIIGLKGIGPKKAAKALSDCQDEEEMFNVVLCMYDGDYDRVIENADLLWIMQEEGVKFSDGRLNEINSTTKS